MRSKIDIYNGALGRIGVRPLTGPADQRDEAVACEKYYTAAVERVLAYSNFQCSVKRAELARILPHPPFGFKYNYELPPDFMHLTEAYRIRRDYSIEGGKFLTDNERCRIIYVRRIDNPAEFSPEVAECVILSLAAKLAAEFSNNPELPAKIIQELEGVALPHARTTDSMQARPDKGKPYWTQRRR